MAQRRDVPNQEFKLRLLASQIRTVSRSVIVLRKIKILKFKGLTEIRLKTFLHFIHTLRIGRTLFALSPPACFARHDGGEGWWLGADVRPDIRNTMSGQARRTRRSRRERPFTAFGKCEAGRSGGNCPSRSARIIHAPVWARHGLQDRKTEGHANAHANDIHTRDFPHLRVFSGSRQNLPRVHRTA